ncbi:MAG: DUF3857 domain-containing protein [Lutibacter sp.]|uniref:DUF3857 domain-containing protein n=1 Tax=Lutibacter sp. TaxID=1925666 RepID=UPI00385C031A
MKKINLLGIFILFFISITYSQKYNFNSSKIPENLRENANSVIRFENTFIEIKSQREMLINREGAITIYNKLADDIADITIYYDKRRTIQKVNGYIYDAFGNEVKKIKKKEFKDYSATGSDLYGDSRVLYYDYTPISYPYTIYYKYQVKTSNTAFIPGWILNGSYYQSVQKAKFTFKYPLDFKLFKSENNFKGYAIKTTENPGILSYETEDIEAIKEEPFTPSLTNFLPYTKLGINKFNLEGVDGEATNWKEFGKWFYDNLIVGTLSLKESTKQNIQRLTAKTSNPIEKAKIVYEFVQNKVRYISIQIGIGGYKPMQANDVDNLGYGDCKALTNYTSALLSAVGIKSYHTLIYANEKRNLDPNVASPQGNHMILYVPIENQDFWLECTSQEHPFAEIGSFTDDRNALVLTPEGGEIKHTKIYNSIDNKQKTFGGYSIDSLGSINANVSIETTGSRYDVHLGKYHGKNKKELDLEFKNYFFNINNINFSKISTTNNKGEAKYEENLEFTASNYSTFSGEQMLLTINAFNKNSYVPKRVRNRKLPFEISRGFLDIDEVEIQLPNSFDVEYIPESIALKTQFGTYAMEITKKDEYTYFYKRTLQIDGGKFEKESYEAYRKFRKQIRKYDNSKIILNKK